jgi:O-phospho-L-seryl-tRNASec:L-selenocysteinyl-tRNA synthase
MNAANLALCEQLVNPPYVRQGAQARRTRESLLASLLAQRRLPDVGWDETSIELLLHELAGLDSNNFPGNAGVGEREGRVFCPLVARRHYRLSHGIGRSGDIAEVQPKAAGSSLLLKLTNYLALDLLRRAGAPSLCAALTLPLATGMSITLVLLALRKLRPGATHVLWPRLDQKACLKAILAAGLTPVVVDGVVRGDQVSAALASGGQGRVCARGTPSRAHPTLCILRCGQSLLGPSPSPQALMGCSLCPVSTLACRHAVEAPQRSEHPGQRRVAATCSLPSRRSIPHTRPFPLARSARRAPALLCCAARTAPFQIETDVDAIRAHMQALGPSAVLCVLSTTSCFAPRAPDNVLALARLCASEDVPHVVNNAYGVQCPTLMRQLEAAAHNGRVDAVVQSTDKNLGVPVGGAIVAAFGKGPCAAHSKALLAKVSSTYPGRASASPVVDAFVTMLHLGSRGYAALVAERGANMRALADAVERVAERHGERLLVSSANPISLAVTLGGCLGVSVCAPPAAAAGSAAAGGSAAAAGSAAGGGCAARRAEAPGGADADCAAATASVAAAAAPSVAAREYTSFGSKLFARLCSGARVVVPTESKTIDGIRLDGFGAHVSGYPHVYFTVAAALGQRPDEIELFAKRLDATFTDFKKARRASAASAAARPGARPASVTGVAEAETAAAGRPAKDTVPGPVPASAAEAEAQSARPSTTR